MISSKTAQSRLQNGRFFDAMRLHRLGKHLKMPAAIATATGEASTIRGNIMGKGKQPRDLPSAQRPGISEIAAHYLESVGGADGTFYQFAQFSQNVGEPGGPAAPGGSFWMQMIKTYPKTVYEPQT